MKQRSRKLLHHSTGSVSPQLSLPSSQSTYSPSWFILTAFVILFLFLSMELYTFGDIDSFDSQDFIKTSDNDGNQGVFYDLKGEQRGDDYYEGHDDGMDDDTDEDNDEDNDEDDDDGINDEDDDDGINDDDDGDNGMDDDDDGDSSQDDRDDHDDHASVDSRNDDGNQWKTSTNSTKSTPTQPLLIHWNDTSRKSPPTLYFCHASDGNGIGEMRSLLESVLPEYRHERVHTKARNGPHNMDNHFKHLAEPNYTNHYDVFITTYQGSCLSYVERWLHMNFNGQIVFISGESDFDHPIQTNHKSSKYHAFGPIPDEEIQEDLDMVLYYFQLTYLLRFRDALSPNQIINSSERPKGNSTKKGFMIYSSSVCVGYRDEAVGLLSQIGQVHYDGKCKGATPPHGNRTNLIKLDKSWASVHNWWRNIEGYSNYKFCFVMEHTGSHEAYITEKILLAFAGGCVPIYYGTERVFNIFNKNAFVFYNISEPGPSLDLVRKLNSDDELYQEMMNEPIAANGEKTIEDYFSFSDEIGNGVLKHKMRNILGLSYLVP